MADVFAGGQEIPLENFAVIFDEEGKPVGITGIYHGEQIVEMGDVEMTMVVKADAFKLAHVHIQQSMKARRLCCVGGRCKTN